MPISVHFRGPMLFVTQDDSGPEANDKIDRIIIPDAGNKGVHDDGSAACPHNAKMLVLRPNASAEYIDLRGATITIAATGESGAPRVDDRFLLVPPLHAMTNPAKLATASVRHRAVKQPGEARIDLVGGRMTGDADMIDEGLELPEHLTGMAAPASVCAMPVWTSPSQTGKISGSSPAGDINVALDSSVDVYVFHWDTEEPTVDQLRDTPDIGPFQDNDFKWIYRLLDPPGHGDWKAWLATDPYFPAPRSVGYLQAPNKIPGQCIADLIADQESLAAAKTNRAFLIEPSPPSSPVSTCDPSRIRGLKLAN